MKNLIPFLFAGLTIMTISCQQKSQNSSHDNTTVDSSNHQDSMVYHDDHNSENSLDWAGSYQDTIPCADCPGILTTVKLYEDGTYSYKAEYLERKTTIIDTGRFMWHNNGSVVHLKGKDINTKYKVGENVLIQADDNGNVVQTDMSDKYDLHKIF